MASDDLDTLARLRGLLDVSRVVRDEEALPDMLRAIAGTIAESLGYKVVVVNLYRPAWDDFEVTTVHDYDAAAVEQLMGSRGGWSAWEPLLDERFKRRGAYFVRAGEYDWQSDMLAITPNIPISSDPNAWHPEDALFVTLTRPDGHLLGILQDAPEPFLLALDGVVDGVAAVDDARIHAEEHELADERIGHDLERESCERLVVRRAALAFLAVLELAAHRRNVGGRGHVVDDGVEHRLNALVLECRAAQHRHDLAGDRAQPQAPS